MVRAAPALVLVLFPLVTGCVLLPIPHMHQQTPEIIGRVHRSGTPIPDVTVDRRAEWDSKSFRDSTRTDQDGRFALDGKRSFHPASVIWIAGIAHDLYEWEVCLEPSGVAELCWEDSAYTPGDAPGTVRLDCDLDLVPLAGVRVSEGTTPAEHRGDYACRAGDREARPGDR